MNIKAVYEKQCGLKSAINFNAELTGWVVKLDDGLYLLEDELAIDIKSTLKVKISNLNIEYALINSVLHLGGGISIFFHQCTVKGLLRIDEFPSIHANSLFILERGETEMIKVDISPEAIQQSKLEYPNFYNKYPDDPWADLYK